MINWFKKKDAEKEKSGGEEPSYVRENAGETTAAAGSAPEGSSENQAGHEPARPGEEADEDRRGMGFFQRLRQGLSKTRSGLAGRLDRLVFGKREIDDGLLDELEEILFTSDLGVSATVEIIDRVKDRVARKELNDAGKLKQALKEEMLSFLMVPKGPEEEPGPGEPRVIMVVGVNGVGKTTTIGKAARRFRDEGKRVMLAAADTFRAAAVEQLVVWGERTGCEVIRQREGADPSAVAFDAVSAAVGRKADVVLIDTAGRLHTRSNLMEELQKTRRVLARKLPGAPHEIWLVLDSTTGQNAVSQARIFNESLGITALVLTKLDGTAKGGVVVGICRGLGLPIRFIGIGEKVDDLRPFDPKAFVDAVFD
jgi:fused signal recognition particle receptor